MVEQTGVAPDMVFRIWNGDRSLKQSTQCSCTVADLIAKGSKKLGMDAGTSQSGMKLVLNLDGTQIDEDAALQWAANRDLVLQLLRHGESWRPDMSDNIAYQEIELKKKMEERRHTSNMVSIGIGASGGTAVVGGACVFACCAIPPVGIALGAVGAATLLTGATGFVMTLPSRS